MRHILVKTAVKNFTFTAPFPRLFSAWTDSPLAPLATENIIFSGGSIDDAKSNAPSLTKKPGAEPKLAVILHGLLGAGRNLRTFTTELFKQVTSQSNDQWIAVLVDLRHHGRSTLRPSHLFHQPSTNTIQAAARDVLDTVHSNWSNKGIDVLIGHSLGGKIALEIAKQTATPYSTDSSSSSSSDDDDDSDTESHEKSTVGKTPSPKQIWCLDSVPGKVVDPGPNTTSGEVLQVLRAVSEIPLPLTSREQLVEEVERRGHGGKVFQQWLASNLRLKRPGEYEWTFNVEGAKELFDSYLQSEYWDVLENPPGREGEIHVVKAMKGGRWRGAMAQKLDHVAAESDGHRTVVHEMGHVGHWMHAQDPKGLAALMTPHILRT